MINNTKKLSLSEAEKLLNYSSETAKKAQSMLSKARLAKDVHTCLIGTNLKSYGLYIEYFGATPVLLMPIYRLLTSPNIMLELVTLQMIFSNNQTRYLKETKKTGCFSTIGKINFQCIPKIIFCEGYLVGSRLYEKTSIPVILGLDAYNLPVVAKNFKPIIPSTCKIIVVSGSSEASTQEGNKAAEMLGALFVRTDSPDFLNIIANLFQGE